MEVGFDGFASLVNTLGGIRVDFEMTTRDLESGLDTSPGCRTLDGSEALSYVRARHVEHLDHGVWVTDGISDSDVGRMARQQVALHALANAAIARAGADPRPLLRALFDDVTVDSHFTSSDALTLFDALRAGAQTGTITLPVAVNGDGLAMTQGAQQVLSIVAGHQVMPSGLGSGNPGATNESVC